MNIYIKGHTFGYEMKNIGMMFLGRVELVERAPEKAERRGDHIYLLRTHVKNNYKLYCQVRYRGMEVASREIVAEQRGDKECERFLALLFYMSMVTVTGKRPAWGISTGVRPATMAAALIAQVGETEALRHLREHYYIQKPKAQLCIETAKNGMTVARRNRPESYSLYVSIPFCPSRCSYCSFVSKTIGRDRGLIGRYLEKLELELEQTAQIALELGLRLETIYIGGGTPTVLEEPELERLLNVIGRNYPVKALAEYCVEAGRPDTITEQKLAALKRAGVSRISINPQTANDKTLARIGREHSAQDAERVFALARQAGFRNINADLIIGLPGETPADFAYTLEWLLAQRPESVTVHALTLKRASQLREAAEGGGTGAPEMAQMAYDALRANGLFPYYMYRQKSTVDALENVGYSLPGYEGLYNVYMMDEIHTILSCGAGAVTKLKQPNGVQIARIFNYKYPAEYIDGFDVLMQRKRGIGDFYHDCEF